jgi:hypothetical protein
MQFGVARGVDVVTGPEDASGSQVKAEGFLHAAKLLETPFKVHTDKLGGHARLVLGTATSDSP